MKAHLFQCNGELRLWRHNGLEKSVTVAEARKFLLTYDDETHYTDISSDNFSTQTEALKDDTIAIVDDTGLHIYNCDVFRKVLNDNPPCYLTSEEFAKKHNRQRRIVVRLCNDGRLKGAIQKNGVWLIPEDTPYPSDARVGSRIYPNKTCNVIIN